MRRTMTVLAVSVMLAMAGPQPFATAAATTVPAVERVPLVRITGAVSLPATYSAADIAALPRITFPSGRPGRSTDTVTGASLEALVAASGPILPAGKNTQLRESITVVGQRGSPVTMALGELDPAFGDHPALLRVDARGHVSLVVPGDSTSLRSVADVRSIAVAVSDAGAEVLPAAGSIRVRWGRRAVDLSVAALGRLPRRSVTVSFLAGTTTQTHIESGPTVVSVLLAARILPVPDTVVTAVGSDGYGAAVTAGEALLGGRPLIVSLREDGVALDQPRLIAAGDVKGGRDVSGVVVLAVSRICR